MRIFISLLSTFYWNIFEIESILFKIIIQIVVLREYIARFNQNKIEKKRKIFVQNILKIYFVCKFKKKIKKDLKQTKKLKNILKKKFKYFF